jgi:hypothetical protein
MISDSTPWKDELEKVADRLAKRKTRRRWTERTSFLVERDIMVSAYALRKLHEAHKISDSFASRQLKVTRHELTGKIPDLHGRYSFWEHYDLNSGTDVTVSLATFYNQIIHSWVWALSATEQEELFDGIYVSSDRNRRKSVYFIAVDTLIDVFRSVGVENVAEIAMARDKNGDMQYVQVPTDAESAARKTTVNPVRTTRQPPNH